MKVLKEWRYRHGKLYSECISRKESYIGSRYREGELYRKWKGWEFYGSKIYKGFSWE